jgi:endonuclease/exonuclease/phosphatase family metal-dependent hydrolase
MDKNIAPFMVDHGILDPGRAQYVTLQPPGEGSLTIINVYAPTLSTDRAHFWSKVESANLASDHYILGGDLNHQEPKEANSSNARQRTRRETSAWHAMTLRLGLSDAWVLDSFHKLSKKTFTYDNGQQGPSSVLTRIDKFLVSQSVEERGGQIEISPSIRKISDHSPLIIKIWGLQRAEQGNRPSYFDLSLLGEEKGRKELLAAWIGAHPPLSLPLLALTGKDGWSQLLAGS